VLRAPAAAGPADRAPAPLCLTLSSSYPRWEGDAAGGFVRGLARAFVAAGWRVEVLRPDSPQAAPRAARPLDDAGITVRGLRYAPLRRQQTLCYGAGAPEALSAAPWRALQGLGLSAAWARAALARRHAAELVLGHWLLPAGLLAAGLAPRRGAAVCHSGGLWLLERLPGRRAIAQALLQGCRRIVFVSAQLRDRFAALLPRRAGTRLEEVARVLPMGVDAPAAPTPAQRAAARAELGLGERPALLCLGRLVPIKGLDRLLQAAQGQDLTLLLAGDGPERAQLAAQARALGLDCRFYGWVEGPQRERLLWAADGLALPSRELAGRCEGSPLALLEALAVGLPVLASASGGVPALLDDGVEGWLLPSGGPDADAAWETGLRDFATQPERRAARAAAALRRGQGHRWECRGPQLVAALTEG